MKTTLNMDDTVSLPLRLVPADPDTEDGHPARLPTLPTTPFQRRES